MCKGITTSKQERERIPIKTMFGNDDDLVAKFNHQHRGEEEPVGAEDAKETVDVRALRAAGAGPNTAQHTRRLVPADRFLEDKTKLKEMPPVSSKTVEGKHQPMIKVSSQKNNGRQGLSTAGPKISFQSSLSPDFLNLFAH